MEVSQFTYFQQVGGIECDPVSTELTYGLERLAMYVQGVESIYALDYNGLPHGQGGITYGDVFLRAERSSRPINFEGANTENLFRAFPRRRDRMRGAAELGGDGGNRPALALPAYDQALKASHLFNLLDARGVISVTERAAYIGRVRTMAKACCGSLAGGRLVGVGGGWVLRCGELLLELLSGGDPGADAAPRDRRSGRPRPRQARRRRDPGGDDAPAT